MRRLKSIYEFMDSRLGDELRPKIIHFFMSGETINDESIEKLAIENHIDKDDVFSVIYTILEDFFHHGHYQDEIKKGNSPNFDMEELRIGKKWEMEHTAGPIIAELIAKDHLVEDPKYYTNLRKCKEGKNNTQI